MSDQDGREPKGEGALGPAHRSESDSSLTPAGRWPTGSERIEEMLDDGRMDRGLHVNAVDVAATFDEADLHLKSAAILKEVDPKGAYALMYDGARKAMAAALASQGLRVKGKDSHRSTFEAVRAQLGDAAGRIVEPFNRMRTRRHEAEYDFDSIIETQDVEEALPKAQKIVSGMRTWAPRLGRF